MKILIIVILCFSLSTVLYSFQHSQEKTDQKSILKKLKDNPTNTFYLSLLAGCYLKKEKYDDAAVLYQKCINLEPDESAFYIKLAQSYDKSGRPDKAKTVITNAANYFDKNPYVLTELASIEYKLGNFSNALPAYEKALTLSEEKEKPFIYNGLAKTYRELTDYEKSRYYFQKALQLKQDCWTFYEYGKLFLDTNEYEQAIWALTKARALSYRQEEAAKKAIINKLAMSYFSYGMKFKDENNKEEAKRMFSQIVMDRELSKTSYGEKASFWLKRL